MRTFQFADLTEPPPLANWGPVTAGFAAAACVAYLANPAPGSQTQTLGSLFVLAAEYVSTIVLTSCLVVWAIHAALPFKQKASQYQLFLYLARVVACLAPIAVFIGQDSLWTLAMVALLGMNTARLAYYCIGNCSQESEALRDSETKHLLHVPDLSAPQFLRPLGVAACAQLTAGSAALGHLAIAATMLCLGSVQFTWLHLANSDRVRREGTGKLLLFVALLIVVTAGGMTPFLEPPQGHGEFLAPVQQSFSEALSALLRGLLQTTGISEPNDDESKNHSWLMLQEDAAALFQSIFTEPRGVGMPENSGNADGPPAVAAVVEIGDRYPGVILHPETEQQVTIVPPLPELGAGLFTTNPANRLSVPFFGAYWFFKPSQGQPPQDSLRSRGDPATMGFSAVDLGPLAMEAHQNFGTLIDYRCCSAIQVAIRNGDRRPGTVSLELILVNTALPARPSLSLGTAPVTSTLQWRPGDDRALVKEMLTFRFAPNSTLQQFDEVTVRFRLRTPRESRSAKIAIERFLFVP